MTDFDARAWNLQVSLACSVNEFEQMNDTEYAINLMTMATLAELQAEETPEHFKANMATRRRLSNWIKQFAQYEEFVDGCWLLMRYYDTGNVLQADDWTLMELHRRWSSLVNLSMYYGNAHQVSNFVPFANGVVSDIVAEILRRKSKCVNKAKHFRPANWRLTASQVKADIDSAKVFEYYFPDMKSTGKNYKAFCKWHPDGPKGNPNLVIFPGIGACKCYRCGASFDVFGMIMDLDKVDFATAIARANQLGT
jgi:hypothetical protein